MIIIMVTNEDNVVMALMTNDDFDDNVISG